MPISLFGKDERKPADILEEGWQLYAKPTTLEPVGTLFRIDDKGHRFLVDQVDIKSQTGAEAAARVKQQVQTNIGFFARFLGVDSYGGKISAKNVEALEFEIIEPQRHSTFDAAIDRALAPVLKALNYRADNRYYVVRETRSATAMLYRLTKTQPGDIGGEASLPVALSAGVSVSAGQGGFAEINQTFPERMRVMFLADQIAPVKSGLAGDAPELGRLKLQTPLVWEAG